MTFGHQITRAAANQNSEPSASNMYIVTGDDTPSKRAGCVVVKPPVQHRRPSPVRDRILTLVAKGWSNGDIAQALGVSPETVKVHIRLLFALYGSQNRTQLAYHHLTGKKSSAAEGKWPGPQLLPPPGEERRRLLARLISEGWEYKPIAGALGASEELVKRETRAILRACDLSTRTQLAYLFLTGRRLPAPCPGAAARR